nr:hypothetical protein [Nitrosopumilus sp.]
EGAWWDLFCDERGGSLDGGCGGRSGWIIKYLILLHFRYLPYPAALSNEHLSAKKG